MIKPNGTDAKDIASSFVAHFKQRSTPAEFKKYMMQAKTLLNSGYSKEEIISVIQHLSVHSKVEIYSLGYINACINDTLREINKLKSEDELKAVQSEIKAKMENYSHLQRNEVSSSDSSTERNRDKISRFGTQSRLGEKFNFDMFEKQRQNH